MTPILSFDKEGSWRKKCEDECKIWTLFEMAATTADHQRAQNNDSFRYRAARVPSGTYTIVRMFEM